MANRTPSTPSEAEHNSNEPVAPKLVVRDRRRVDPATGTLRPPSDVSPAGESATGEAVPPERKPSPGGTASVKPAGSAKPKSSGTASAKPNSSGKAKVPAKGVAEVEKLSAELAERTSDLKRISAEYANYRKRTERERDVMAEQGITVVLSALLPVLDDIERAREHGDLTGGFAGVAEQLITTLNKLGLTGFAQEGDAFDPTWHEAVAHSGDGNEPHIVNVLRKGYALGDRMLRPALVVVGDAPTPEDPDETKKTDSTTESTTPSDN